MTLDELTAITRAGPAVMQPTPAPTFRIAFAEEGK
jgi:hypothetical protein